MLGIIRVLSLTGVLRLVLRLLFDRRVPFGLKMVLPLAILYVISPVDLVHDFMLYPRWARLRHVVHLGPTGKHQQQEMGGVDPQVEWQKTKEWRIRAGAGARRKALYRELVAKDYFYLVAPGITKVRHRAKRSFLTARWCRAL